MAYRVVFIISVSALLVHCNEGPIAPAHVPNIPSALLESQQEVEASSLIYLWQNRISKQAVDVTAKDAAAMQVRSPEQELAAPKTVLAVDPFLMSNLVPQDAPHPLYSDKYTQLTDEFILDSLSTDVADVTKFDHPEGAIIKTISGKDLIFKKSATDEVTVNDIGIKRVHQTLGSDPITVFIVSDFLFNHRKDVQDAFKVLSKENTGNVDFLG